MLGMSGGPLAILAMAAFLPIALYVGRRLPRALAIASIVVGGTMFLPDVDAVLFDLPVIPAMEKDRIIYLSALFVAMGSFRRDFAAVRPGLGLELVFPLMFIGYLFTASQNRLPVVNYGNTYDGLGIYWIMARSIDDLLTFVLPFVIGRTMIRGLADLRTLAYVLVGAGVLYFPIIASEALLSIYFHVWQWQFFFYDVAARASWRWGGIQPVGFMAGPLAAGSFMAITVIFAAAFAASKSSASWFGVRRAHLATQMALLMTRVTSSNLYGVVFGFALRLLTVRASSLIALCAAAVVVTYPALRLAGLFPYETMVQFVRDNLNEERAHSFEGRFMEENFVFDGLGDRLLFGWGMFDRIPGAATFGTGEKGLDSFFVIRVGLNGIIGAELIYLLLFVPVLVAWRRVSGVQQREAQLLMVALMLCVAARMIDTLLNDIWTSLPFFLSGALLGAATKDAETSQGLAAGAQVSRRRTEHPSALRNKRDGRR